MGAAVAPVAMGVLGAGAVLATGGTALPALAVGAAAMSAGSSIMGGYSQGSAYSAQSLEDQQQARLAKLQAKVDESDRLQILVRSIGSNKVAAAAGNIDVDSPSVQAMNNANRDKVAQQIGLTNLSAETTAGRLQMASAMATSAAQSSVLSGYGAGAQSIFGAGMGLMQIGSVPTSTANPAILGPLANSPVLQGP